MRQDEQDFPVFRMDGIDFRLRRMTDLSWLPAYGKVFRILDQLPSGNLCFGVEGPYGKLFIKYAGADPVNYAGKPQDAVEWLRRSPEIYGSVRHDLLIPMLSHGWVREGYVTIFPWQDAQPLRPMPPSDRTRTRVRQLPLVDQLKMLDGVFDLQASAVSAGWIPADFTDEHVLIDFESRRALVCDLDQYRQKPAVNTRGRMPGSARFLAPEEYLIGEPLEEDTAVYKLGALAFEFFGDNYDRGAQSWFGPGRLYEAAARAVEEDRKKRFRTVWDFVLAWRDAVSATHL